MYADDIILLSHDPLNLQRHLDAFEIFCNNTCMEVNLLKSKIIIMGSKVFHSFLYKSQALEQVKSYKYISIDFSQTYSWTLCVLKRVEAGYKALYSLLNHCRQVHLQAWDLKKTLFKSLVLPVILYGVQVWGASIKMEIGSELKGSKTLLKDGTWC